ncbi:MAG: exodeoxyribonuclease VII large subunit [Nanoarchaeota archaeon]
MQTPLLIKISLTTAIVGLILLIYLSQNLEPKIISISEVNFEMLDNYVKITGTITEVRQTQGLYIFEVGDISGKITATYFKDKIIDKSFEFSIGDEVEILGKVSEYEKEIQIEIVEIRKI